jgi:hypothetical protein
MYLPCAAMEDNDRQKLYLNAHKREQQTVNDLILNKYIDDYRINPELSKLLP